MRTRRARRALRSRLALLAPIALGVALLLSWGARIVAQPSAAPKPAAPAAKPATRVPPPPAVAGAPAVAVAAAAPASPDAPDALATPDASVAATPSPGAGVAAPADGPVPVYVGVYAFQVPQLALAESNYLVDFWVWFRWKGDFNPTETFELLNQFEGDIVRTYVYVDEAGNPKAEDVGDGWQYQVMRIQSRFGRSFDVRDYPFDDQELTIAFEDNDQTTDQMVYVADKDTDLVDPGLKVDGWMIDHISAKVGSHAYPTNWGDPRRGPGEDRYSQFSYTIHLRRPVLGYLATTLVPIAICMLITISVFFLGVQNFEAKLGLATTCLISAVALQLTAQGDLPKTGQMVLLDHVYNLSYVTILITLVECIWSARLHDAEQIEKARKLDLIGLAITVVVFFGGTTALIASRI